MTKAERIAAARVWHQRHIIDRAALESELSALRTRLFDVEAARNALQAFVDTPDWASLDGTIDIDTIVRFGAFRYKARARHVKALTRSPLNLIYWEIYND